MARALTPTKIRAPFARYSHGIEVPRGRASSSAPGSSVSAPTTRIPVTVEGQAELCFNNIGAILSEAGLDFSAIIRVNAYVTAREHMKGYMAVRDRYVGNPPPASTLMIVSGFTRPEFLVEVEVIAAAD